jgi:hypothetical protein
MKNLLVSQESSNQRKTRQNKTNESILIPTGFVTVLFLYEAAGATAGLLLQPHVNSLLIH